jgi:quercetin dioxygenase-like cupin family protein
MGWELIPIHDGELLTLLVTSKENSTFSVMHSRLKSGASAPIHYHEHDHEAFYVLNGTVRFISGSESQYVLEAKSGTIIVCPPCCTRGYQAVSDAVMIVINYPSGPGEGFIRDFASIDAMPPKRDEIKRFASRYGIHVLKAYDRIDVKPLVADLSKDGPLVVGDICFSHGSENEDEGGENGTMWLFACDTNNKSPHVLPIGSKTGPEVFCVGRA